jgi:hypothetical protein
VRPSRGARIDRKLLIDDLARKPLDRRLHVRARAGKADVGVVDADRIHEMQNAELVLDRRIGD